MFWSHSTWRSFLTIYNFQILTLLLMLLQLLRLSTADQTMLRWSLFLLFSVCLWLLHFWICIFHSNLVSKPSVCSNFWSRDLIFFSILAFLFSKKVVLWCWVLLLWTSSSSPPSFFKGFDWCADCWCHLISCLLTGALDKA